MMRNELGRIIESYLLRQRNWDAIVRPGWV